MKKSVWGWIVAGVAAVGATIVVAYEELKKPSSPSPPTPPAPQPNVLQPNTTYSLTLTCPTSLQGLFPPVPVPPDAAAAIMLAGIPVVPESFTFSPDGKSATLVFTYTGAQPLPLPPIQQGNATACTTTLTQTVSGVHHGPPPQGGGHNFLPPQQVTLPNGQTVQASNVPGGAIIVTTQGTITGINGPPVKSWSNANGNSNQATIVLSGTAGSIVVAVNEGGQPTGGTIQVS